MADNFASSLFGNSTQQTTNPTPPPIPSFTPEKQSGDASIAGSLFGGGNSGASSSTEGASPFSEPGTPAFSGREGVASSLFGGGSSSTKATVPNSSSSTGSSPDDPWYKKAWDFVNAPLIDESTIEHWLGREHAGGFEKGLYDLVSGLTSPLSIGLAIGTFGSGALFESGGAVALRAAGMGAEEIGAITKGSEVIADAVKSGKDVWKAVDAAGLDRETIQSGLEKLSQAGIKPESLISSGLIRRSGAAMLRQAGVDIGTSENVATGIQALIDGGFTAQNAYSAVTQFPRVLDALREGDYDTAKRLAVDALGSAGFAYLGGRGVIRDAGGLMEDLRVKTGLRVAPTEENQRMIRSFGKYDRDVVSSGRGEELWSEDIRQNPEYKDIVKDKPALERIMKYIQAGMDDRVLAERRNNLALAGGMGDEVRALPSSSVPPSREPVDFNPLTPKGNGSLVEAVHNYNERRLSYQPPRGTVDVDPRSAQIADAYDAMQHNPNDPLVRDAYNSLKREIKAQWDYATKDLKIKFEGMENDPYKNSAEMMNDVRNNKHLRFFKGVDMPEDHPLAQVDPETKLTYNEMFRAVHDLFGHAVEGFEFGAKGEENAWNAHRRMFSPESLPALTTETKGQNSWVNSGKHLRDAQGNVAKKGEAGFVAPQDRPFAEQKAGLLPREFWFRPEDKPITGEDALKLIQGNKNFAILQAENPLNIRITPDENARRSQAMEDDLRNHGYNPIPVEGNTKDVAGQKEHAFFVPDMPPEAAVRFGRKYRQAGILTREGLHWINQRNAKLDYVNPSKNSRLITGDEARTKDYFTVIRDSQGNEIPFHVPVDMERKIVPGSKLAAPRIMKAAAAAGGEASKTYTVRDEGISHIPPSTFLERVGGAENRNPATVADWKKQFESGAEVPPVSITFDENGNLIDGDGRHRATAAREAGVERIPVNIKRRVATQDAETNVAELGDAMTEARIREMIDKKSLQNSSHYNTPEKMQALLDSYDHSKLTPSMKALAREISDHFTETLERAQDHGALNEGIENYVTQLWEKEEANNPAANRLLHGARNGAFSTNTAMARHRMFQSAFEGELFGKKLAVTDPIALAANNRNSFERVIAARKVLAEMQDKGYRASDGRPMVALATSGQVLEGENGENPAVLVNPSSIRNIKISQKVIQGLKESGDLDRLLESGAVVPIGHEYAFPNTDIRLSKDVANAPDPRNLQNKTTESYKRPIYAWNTQDYRTIGHPAFRGWKYATQDTAGRPVLVQADLRVHPDAYEYLDRRLGEKPAPNPVKNALLKAGQEAKGFLLFGSPFHLFQEGLRAVMTGISPFGMERWDLRTDPVLAKGVESGLTLGRDFKGIEAFEEGKMAGHSKIIQKIPVLGKLQDAVQSFLFDKYIPNLKQRAYKDLFVRYQEAFPKWSIDKIAETAAADTNERFGGINYQRMGRSIATQDAFRLVALAPDWLESEMRFMARAFGEEGKIARFDTARMAVGLFMAARVLNYLTTGNVHAEAPFGLALKDKDGKEKVYSIRTLPTDMLHAVSDPGGFLSGRVAPLMRAGVQTYTGRDEFGRKLPTHNIFTSVINSASPIPLQTAVKAATGETPDVTNADQLVKLAGGTVFPYRTEAEKLAAKKASDHSETGPVDQAQLRTHQVKIRFEDDLRTGRMQPNELFQLVETGQLSVKDAKDVMKAVQETHGMEPEMAAFYSRASRLPTPDFLEVWDTATNDEKAVLAKLLIKKRIAYFKKVGKDMTPQERANDVTYRRLRTMFPNEPPF